MDSLCHPWFTTANLSYRFPIFETSATALCGTTGNDVRYISLYKPSEFGEKIVDDSNTSIDLQWALECSQHSRTLWSICFKSLIRLPNQADRHPPSYAESKVSYKFSVFPDFQAKLESSTWTSLTSTRFQHGLRNPRHFMLFCFIARLALVGFLAHSDGFS